MESDIHLVQMLILLSSLQWRWRGRKDFFAAGNLSIYYKVVSGREGRAVQKKLAFRGPDFFVVLGAWPKPRRNSWVVENEGGKTPDVIVEILSKSTQAADRGKKKAIYEKVFKTPEYFLFDPEKIVLEGYRLSRGRYVSIVKDGAGRLWSERLEFALGTHAGKLRFFDGRGGLVALPEEDADKEKAASLKARVAAREAKAQLAEAEAEAAALRRRLRALGVKV